MNSRFFFLTPNNKNCFQESLLGTKLRKLNKKSKNAVDIDSILNSIPTPSVKNTLPFQLVRGVWNTPSTIKSLFHEYADYKQQQRQEQERYVGFFTINKYLIIDGYLPIKLQGS